MTKSPRAVAREAMRLAQEALPVYSSKFSRKDFTQHQLFALLALKTFCKTDYRGAPQVLDNFAELRADLGLAKVPHYSMLSKAEQRLRKGEYVLLLFQATVRVQQGALTGAKPTAAGRRCHGDGDAPRERGCRLRVLTHNLMLLAAAG